MAEKVQIETPKTMNVDLGSAGGSAVLPIVVLLLAIATYVCARYYLSKPGRAVCTLAAFDNSAQRNEEGARPWTLGKEQGARSE